MRSKLLTLVAALLWDRALGEPHEMIHPVVGVGKAVDFATRHGLRGNPRQDMARGIISAAGLPIVALGAAGASRRFVRRFGTIPAFAWNVFLLKSTFAIKAMYQTGSEVADALEREDLVEARSAAAKIVSRDVSQLGPGGIASAAVGSITENVTDTAVGPLLAYGALGLPGAIAYRSINTLDAMTGYRDHREYFGKASAKLDDVVNLIPARISGGVVVTSAMFTGLDSRNAVTTMFREHGETPSPNGGWPIAAASGALGIEIEKVGYYRVGKRFRQPDAPDVRRSLTLFGGAAAVGAAIAAGIILARRR